MTATTIEAITAYISDPSDKAREQALISELNFVGLTRANDTIEAINRLLHVIYPPKP